MSMLRRLLQPLNLAAYVTWLAVALAMRGESSALATINWPLLLLFLLAFVLHELPEPFARRVAPFLLAVQLTCALALSYFAESTGTAPVLLVIVAAQLATLASPALATAVLGVANVGLFLALRWSGHSAPLLVTTIYLGFQAFAALTGHYAATAERARDALARVNADLLATRSLLADSARDAERLRVARELHDVAGHKLTALTLNLRALGSDPALAGRPELRVAQQLAAELMADIRGIVQAMRDHRGLDLSTALHALAAPLPRPRLELDLDPALRVDDPALAETLLRVVQEALTNSARHAGAERVRVRIARAGDHLDVAIEDDGRLRAPLREGNGLAGMRERVEAIGGTLAFGAAPAGGLRIDARLPA